MTPLKSIQLPGQIHSAAIAPGGDYAIAAVEGDRLIVLDTSTLETCATHAIPAGDESLPPGTRVSPRETRVAFLDERSLLVARTEYLFEPEDSHVLKSISRTRLLAVDSETGQVRGQFESDACVMRTGPVPIAPQHVLLSHDGLALVCVDTTSWREVCRVGERAADHDPKSNIEEELAEHGVVYDPHRGLVHVFWRYFNAGIVQSYRFDADRSRFERVSRGPKFEGQDACYEANGLCVSPAGTLVAAWFAIADAVIEPGEAGAPAFARIGRLGLYEGRNVRFLDVKSEVARDLLVEPVQDGQGADLGLRVGADFFEFRPIFLDESRVLLNTPGGLLLGIDIESGRTELLHDFHSPIVCLELHRETRLLLAGCEDRSVHLIQL